MGLDNLWDLWTSDDGRAVISLRGTTAKPESWLENVYAAMVPARGKMVLESNYTFEYDLSDHPQAAVHVGWLIGTGFLVRDIKPKLDSLVQSGIKNFYLVGHSQGGAITYLLNAYFMGQQKLGKLNSEIRFKTYCSAAPKPGNLFFAYSYEAQTQFGWAFNVINAADWVPQVPISIQTIDDFSSTNPFKGAKKAIKKQKFPTRTAMKHVYKKLDKPTRKARKNYQTYLGKMTSKLILKQVKELKVPTYFESNHYVRTGTTITLYPDQNYNEQFPESETEIFQHHFHKPYLLLLDQLKID